MRAAARSLPPPPPEGPVPWGGEPHRRGGLRLLQPPVSQRPDAEQEGDDDGDIVVVEESREKGEGQQGEGVARHPSTQRRAMQKRAPCKPDDRQEGEELKDAERHTVRAMSDEVHAVEKFG